MQRGRGRTRGGHDGGHSILIGVEQERRRFRKAERFREPGNDHGGPSSARPSLVARGPVPRKASNRDLRTLRAAFKKATPEYRFPAGAFVPWQPTANPAIHEASRRPYQGRVAGSNRVGVST